MCGCVNTNIDMPLHPCPNLILANVLCTGNIIEDYTLDREQMWQVFENRSGVLHALGVGGVGRGENALRVGAGDIV